MKRTQEQRLLDYLTAHPGASSLEITHACYIVNVTGRVSDLRSKGHTIVDRREGGVHRYYIVEGQLSLSLAG